MTDPKEGGELELAQSRPRSPDSYEEAFMNSGTIAHRDKIVAPWWLHAILGFSTVAAAAGSIAAVADGAPLFLPFVMIAMAAFVWANSYALRIAVTADKVLLQYGLFGPRIPVEDIVFCEAQAYNAMTKYGGWGIKYSLHDGSWAFNMPGDDGTGVMIHYKTRLGIRKVFVSSHHPNVLAESINAARKAKGHDIPEHLLPDDAELGLNAELLYQEVQTPDVDAANAAGHEEPELDAVAVPGGEDAELDAVVLPIAPENEAAGMTLPVDETEQEVAPAPVSAQAE